MGHFTPPDLNSREKQELMRLMTEVQFQLDIWFSRSILDLFNAFSLFLTVMLVTLGIVNLVVARAGVDAITIKRLSFINALGMTAMLGLSIVYAFSVPITLFLIVMGLFVVSFVRG